MCVLCLSPKRSGGRPTEENCTDFWKVSLPRFLSIVLILAFWNKNQVKQSVFVDLVLLWPFKGSLLSTGTD